MGQVGQHLSADSIQSLHYLSLRKEYNTVIKYTHTHEVWHYYISEDTQTPKQCSPLFFPTQKAQFMVKTAGFLESALKTSTLVEIF